MRPGLPKARQGWRRLSPLFFCLGLALPAIAEIRIDIEGHHFFRASQILASLPADPEVEDQRDLLAWQDEAIEAVSDLYRRQGFFDINSNLVLDSLAEGQKYRRALLKVFEGERYRWDSVFVAAVDSGRLPLISDPEKLGARFGQPYREEVLLQDKRVLMRQYGDAGFVRAEVEHFVFLNRESKRVRLEYRISPSYPVIFDTLILSNRRPPPADSLPGLTREDALRSLLPYQRGDTVRISRNDQLIAKLQYTHAFRYARLKDSLGMGEGHRSALILQSEERVPGHLRTALQWESQYGVGVAFDISHSNIAGTLNELHGGTGLAVDRQNLYLGYGSPLTLGYLIRFDNDLNIDWYQDKAVHTEEGFFGGDFRAANTARLTWPWSYWLNLITNAELESKSRLLEISGSRERSLNLNFIQSAQFSFLNQMMDPSRGMRQAFSWGNGGSVLEDGEFRFAEFRHNWLEFQSGYYYYLPPWSQIGLAFRLDGGRFFGAGGTNSDRFFLGGGRSVRSYAYQDLCPERHVDLTDTTRTVCSTENLTAAYFLTSYELRLSPFALGYISPRGFWNGLIPLKFVPFFDFGKVWNAQGEFSLHSQMGGQGLAYGLGLRYPLLGVFNLRLDFAYGDPKISNQLAGVTWPDTWVLDLAQAF